MCSEKKKKEKDVILFPSCVNTFLRSFGVCNSLDCVDAGALGRVVGPGPDQAAAQSLRGCQSCCGAAEPGSAATTAGSPYPGQRIKKDTGLVGDPLKNVKRK